MSYCPICGNKVDETMAFCPSCGAALKSVTPGQPAQPATQYPRNEKDQKNQKQEKSEHGFIGHFIGGLILITIGVFSILDLTSTSPNSGQDLAAMLLIIGIIIIVGAVYVALTGRKRFPTPVR
jgi:uncharacterized membrane protein YvbJ